MPGTSSLPPAAKPRPAPHSAGGPKRLTFLKLGLIIAFMGLLAVIGTTVVMVRVVGGLTQGTEAGPTGEAVRRPPVLIQSRGRYPSPDGRFACTVMLDQSGGVRYSVLAADTFTKLVSGVIDDASEPWAISWDQDNNLWVYAQNEQRLHRIVTTVTYREQTGWLDDPALATAAPIPLAEWVAQRLRPATTPRSNSTDAQPAEQASP